MRSEPQRHRDTEELKGPSGPKTLVTSSLCLCASVVNRTTAAAAQRVIVPVGLAALPDRQLVL